MSISRMFPEFHPQIPSVIEGASNATMPCRVLSKLPQMKLAGWAASSLTWWKFVSPKGILMPLTLRGQYGLAKFVSC